MQAVLSVKLTRGETKIRTEQQTNRRSDSLTVLLHTHSCKTVLGILTHVDR